MFNAVRPTEPPTGCPWKSPARTLPTPWAMKSWFASERELSGFGAHSGALDEHERGDRDGPGGQAQREIGQMRKHRQWESPGDLADVTDALHRL
jgi:hypothetical protein